jgi:hypothetical protein
MSERARAWTPGVYVTYAGLLQVSAACPCCSLRVRMLAMPRQDLRLLRTLREGWLGVGADLEVIDDERGLTGGVGLCMFSLGVDSGRKAALTTRCLGKGCSGRCGALDVLILTAAGVACDVALVRTLREGSRRLSFPSWG